jgi:hypothetical protein
MLTKHKGPSERSTLQSQWCCDAGTRQLGAIPEHKLSVIVSVIGSRETSFHMSMSIKT